jgi:predicted transcriptional regulator
MAGRKISLTKLEGEVMRIVWGAEPDPIRVREVVDTLNDNRRPPLAYNTIQTVLTILRDKGIVRVVAGGGRGHHYRARVSRGAAMRDMVAELAQRLFDGDVQPMLQQLIDEGDMGRADLEALREWVDQRLCDEEGPA